MNLQENEAPRLKIEMFRSMGFSYFSDVRKRVSRMCYFPNGGFKGTSQNSACTYEGII
jgi:hypothetical protein